MSIKEKLTFKNIAIGVAVTAVVGGITYYLLNSDDTDSIAELASSVTEATAEAVETVVETATK